MKPRSAMACAAVALVAAVCCVSLARAAVIGIDFGSEFIKVAIVKPGKPFHIVVDETAKRKVPAMVAFDGDDRMIGTAAQGVAVRRAQQMYAFMHTLLGKTIDSPAVDNLRKLHYPYEFVAVDGRTAAGAAEGEDGAAAAASAALVGVKHSADQTFQPEDLIAMNFQQIKKIAEIDAESPVKDCVITVPAYFSQLERQAVIDSAELAGLNVLALVHENTAAAIQYGIDRTYTDADVSGVNTDGTPYSHHVLLYNMGTTATKVSVVSYTAYNQTVTKKQSKTVGQMEIKAVAHDDLLGGRDFDGRLVDFFASEFTAQIRKKGDNTDVYKNARVMAKFREAANKAKTVLSANPETQVAIAGVVNDHDFKMLLSRDKFLALSQDLIERSTIPVAKALEESGIPAAKLAKVILIGGGVRIPAIQSALKTLLNRDILDQNLNGDEAMAMGAAFMAANMSTAFRVRPFGMTDATPFPVGVRLSNLPAPAGGEPLSEEDRTFSKRATLFSRNNKLEKRKTVAFSHRHDIAVQMAYDSAAKYLPAAVSAQIATFNVTGISAIGKGDSAQDKALAELIAAGQKPRVALKFVLDASGMVDLVRAEATLDDQIKVPVEPKASAPAKPADDKVNATATATADGEKKAEGDAAAEKKEDAPAAAAAEKTPEELAAEKEAQEKADKEAGIIVEKDADGNEKRYTLKKKTHRFVLTITKGTAPGAQQPLNRQQKSAVTALLNKLTRVDERKAEIAAAKNAVESFIYGVRGRLYDESDVVYSVSNEEQREKAIAELSAAEDWLQSTPANEPVESFTAKLEELKKASAAMFFRADEVKDRALAINSSNTIANYTRHLIVKLEKSMPWVTADERTELSDLVDGVEKWLAGKTADQAALQPYDTPAFTSEQLLDKLRPIAKLGQSLLKKKKPAEKKPPKPAADAAAAADGAAADNSTTPVLNATADATAAEGEAPATDKPADAAATDAPAGDAPAGDAPAGDAPHVHTEL